MNRAPHAQQELRSRNDADGLKILLALCFAGWFVGASVAAWFAKWPWAWRAPLHATQTLLIAVSASSLGGYLLFTYVRNAGLAAVSSWQSAGVIVGVWWLLQVYLGWRYAMAKIAFHRDRNTLPNDRQESIKRACQSAAKTEAQRHGQKVVRRFLNHPTFLDRLRLTVTRVPREFILGTLVQNQGRLMSWLFPVGGESSRRGKQSWRRGRYVVDIGSAVPLIIVGTTGCGKSTLIRMILIMRLLAGQQVIAIDPKDTKSQALLRRMAEAMGYRVRVWGEHSINILPRNVDMQFNVLIRFLPTTKSTDYFRITSEGLIRAFLEINGPVRDVKDFLSQFGDWEKWATTEMRQRGGRGSKAFAEHVAETTAQLESTLGRIPNISSDGVSVFDSDWDLVLVPAAEAVIPGSRYLVAALTYLIRMRAMKSDAHPQQLTYLVDEAIDVLKMVDMDELPELMEQLRSTPVQLIIAAQDLGRFPNEGGPLMSSGATLMAMRQRNSEPSANLIGTRIRPESTQQMDSMTPTGLGSLTLQNYFIVSPDELRDAERGEVWLSVSGEDPLHFIVQPPVESAQS